MPPPRRVRPLVAVPALRPDVALIHVSPPDRHGFCSLGVSVDVTRAAVQTARTVIAQVNPRMPRTHGDGLIHVESANYMVKVDEPIPELASAAITDVERAIARHCAELVEDGATLQLGIGAIPDAVLSFLGDKRALGQRAVPHFAAALAAQDARLTRRVGWKVIVVHEALALFSREAVQKLLLPCRTERGNIEDLGQTSGEHA